MKKRVYVGMSAEFKEPLGVQDTIQAVQVLSNLYAEIQKEFSI